MEKSLTGKHIVLGASRKTEEMSLLIEKQGGTASVRSLQGTVFKAENEVKFDLQKFIAEGADWVIFTTGVGIQALLDLAENLGEKEEFIAKIKEAKVASRGYKSQAALKQVMIQPVASDDDGTTQGLIRQLADFDLSNQKVLVQLHGEKAPELIKFLTGKGANVSQILPYQHIPPVPEIVETLCQELYSEKVDAVCFTTAIQVRSLFDYAREKGYANKIQAIFKGKTIAAAVGKVTAEALREEGIERLVVPKHERMGAMIVELAQYFADKK
ncbi:uroporphyrinogen-III synthase [Bacillus benzoevorans]|uniref:Uroporphyrinogen-III synthase n=1 Tax=Bacillus benzoevorans TaxID=1456 RepID=A0A7X0HQQ9_9BACI|nr:uroporphyrinogen-III synthase [Bacillus benzoevorans]MBB6445200.1 uroporphyrinogen-III synthase [Bacillus benzoevorans]